MATRRPASSRARVNNNTNLVSVAPPLPRSRSVMSRTVSTTHPADDSNDRERTTATVSKHMRTNSLTEDAETNIQVVIRCRRRSEREIQDNSPIIVSSSGAKSKEVSIEVSAPVSSLGVVTLPPTRTYPFDLVFGPEADQATIYHEVVSPMLDEVLLGYNCTLFAYGQTGTGKTYTMQGDLTPTPMGNPSSNAGMIPRVLFRLFHHLETSKMDYSVKISYIELYNEELRDLLANDLSAPVGNTQPMGMANKDQNKNVDNGLKIFDDASKRGVMIQGLEEIAVKDSQDALALLTKGSHRRQIAATRFNDHSSRSHSVFSITVHLKESSLAGEDLLKIGKLNLVDLAGSENIGRSGAENKRAREAGMINQSLLTLGRVINALVDKAQHIPYRESKLTRLLQDSLGGRTKTCIVATISPARSNMEETFSTLDYALRAKSIRNKPELNQRMTRNSLLKEYVSEIERLKADLLAAREKNGIFFSEETWNQMTVEQELRQTELEEARKQVEIVETQMRGVREEFEQSIGLLKIREGELRETQLKLSAATEMLGRKEDELIMVKGALEEEVVIRKAHQDTEVNLDSVAHGLKAIAGSSIQDVKGLFEKLERKTTVLNSNSQAIMTHGQIVSTSRQVLSQKLDEFLKIALRNASNLQFEASEFQQKEIVTLSSHSERVEEQLQHAQHIFQSILEKGGLEDEALTLMRSVLTETHNVFKAGFGAWSESLTKTYAETSRQVEQAGVETFSLVEGAFKTMSSLVEVILSEHQEYVDAEYKMIQEAKALTIDASQDELARLKQQNETLAHLLDTERVNADKAKDEMLQRVSKLLGDFTQQRDTDLRLAIAAVQNDNIRSEKQARLLAGQHTSIMQEMEASGGEMGLKLKARNGESKRTRDGAYKVLGNAKTHFSSKITAMQRSVSESVTSYSADVRKQTEAMTGSCNDAFERHGHAKRARIDLTASIAADVQSEYRKLRRSFASTSRNVEGFASRVISDASGLNETIKNYGQASSTQLENISGASAAMFIEGVREDTITGSTPRKRVWEYVDKWELTKPRDVVLQTWRDRGVSKTGSDTFLAENLPLPEGGEDIDDNDNTARILDPTRLPTDPDVENIPILSQDMVSLNSSTSSAASISTQPARAPLKRALSHRQGVPSLGTLTDSRNVYTSRRPRRAR